MRSRLVLLVLEFVALSVPLTWLWVQWGREAYYRAFVQVSRPFLLAMGITGVRRDLLHDRFISYLPFLVLIIITPALSLRRRIIGALVGCFVIYCGQLGLTYAAFVAFIRSGEAVDSMARLFPAYIFSDALPFILWAIIANEVLREGVAGIFQSDDVSTRNGDESG